VGLDRRKRAIACFDQVNVRHKEDASVGARPVGEGGSQKAKTRGLEVSGKKNRAQELYKLQRKKTETGPCGNEQHRLKLK